MLLKVISGVCDEVFIISLETRETNDPLPADIYVGIND
jgi:hypothetical protein